MTSAPPRKLILRQMGTAVCLVLQSKASSRAVRFWMTPDEALTLSKELERFALGRRSPTTVLEQP